MSWLPAIERDPSWKAVVDLITTRFRALPVAKAVVWHLPTADTATIAHIAQMLGVDVSSAAEPMAVLHEAIRLRRRRGTKSAVMAGLAAAGREAGDVELVRDTVWRHDGTIDRSGNGEWLYGGDAHWATFVARVEVAAWPTLAEVQALWQALDGSKSERDRVVLVVRHGDDLCGIYRAAPTAVLPEGVLEGALHRWRGDVAVGGLYLVSMPDMVGDLNLTAPVLTIAPTTVGGRPAWDLGASGSGRFLEADLAGALALEAGSVFVVADVAGPSLEAAVLFCTGRASAPTTEETFLINYNGTFYGRRVAVTTGDLVLSEQLGTIAMLLTWDPSGAELWVNGALAASNATEAEPQPAGRLTIGALVNANFSGGFKFAEAQLSNTRQSGEGIDALFAYSAARYGV